MINIFILVALLLQNSTMTCLMVWASFTSEDVHSRRLAALFCVPMVVSVLVLILGIAIELVNRYGFIA